VLFFQDRVSGTICPGLPLNCDPPDLCPLSNWDYRHELPAHGSALKILTLALYYRHTTPSPSSWHEFLILLVPTQELLTPPGTNFL
jgi:hypothetical protein